MAENSTPEDRTEMPTDKRMQQLRNEGAIPMSTETVMVASLLAGFFGLQLMWSWILKNFKIVLVGALNFIRNSAPLTSEEIISKFHIVLLMILPPLLIMLFLTALVSILVTMLQTKWNVKSKWFELKWSFLNPIGGIRRIFSINGVVTTLKSIVKLMLILPIAYFALREQAPQMIGLMHLQTEEIMFFTGSTIRLVFWRILYILIAMAIFDFFWGRYQWLRANKMTKDEVKDERKAVEGDETTKRKIQAKGLQRIWMRIANSVPQADVVVTNPTHYAVALKYDRKTMKAPKVLAKGKGFLAERIKEIAREAGVPILERKPLARALYSSVEVGMEIPYELFKAVAEVLAYVYRLRNPWGYMRQHAKG